MKIALLNIRSRRKECVIKEVMGGFGLAFHIGNSLPARLIEFAKKKGENLPLVSFGYLAAIFKENGHDVIISNNEVPEADLVIISSSMVDYKYEIEWAKKVREEKIKVGIIGPFASVKPALFLSYCDFVIQGEPEEVAYKIKDGWIPEGIVTSHPIKNLDSLPFPDWSIFPIESYSYFPALKERPFLPILSSRGCFFSCSYCPYLVNYKYRMRSVNNVVEEIEYLKERFHIRGLLFRDPLFGADKDMARGIAQEIVRRKISLRWACETRLDLLDKDLIDLLYQSGLRVINVGIESSSEDILRKVERKPIKSLHQEEIINYCDRLGIRVTAFYLLGLPEDTEESIKNTVNYAKRLNTHVAQFFVHTPIPGTEYFEKVKERLLENDWEKFDGYTPVVKHENLSPGDLLRLKEWAFVSYYYRPSYAVKFFWRLLRDLRDGG